MLPPTLLDTIFLFAQYRAKDESASWQTYPSHSYPLCYLRPTCEKMRYPLISNFQIPPFVQALKLLVPAYRKQVFSCIWPWAFTCSPLRVYLPEWISVWSVLLPDAHAHIAKGATCIRWFYLRCLFSVCAGRMLGLLLWFFWSILDAHTGPRPPTSLYV